VVCVELTGDGETHGVAGLHQENGSLRDVEFQRRA
jgi:hypothetical protein